MADPRQGLPHIWVDGRASDRTFARQGGGDKKIRPVEHRAHGLARRQELHDAIKTQLEQRADLQDDLVAELRALGVVVVLESSGDFPLKVESLERLSGTRQIPQWRLLSVTPADAENPERAMVWVSDSFRGRFLKYFEQYLNEKTKKGEPKNKELIANISRIQAAVLENLWQSDGRPPAGGTHWWELWLTPGTSSVDLLREFVEPRQLRVHDRVLHLVDRSVTWIHGSWDELRALPFTAVPLTEIRAPEFADTLEDLTPEDQAEFAEELAARITSAATTAPAVCHLDTGVRHTHALLAGSLATSDVHSVVDQSGAAVHRHGTLMAGLALFGPLDDLLLGTATPTLTHRLESVKILPDHGQNHPLAYGLLTAQAVALPEATNARPRVFCMPVTAEPDRAGEPSLWSASIDALAVGVDVGAATDGINLLSAPNHQAARLFVISAGNVPPTDFQADYLAACDTSAIQDPAHAWNALAVGAYTELTDVPTDPTFTGWTPVGTAGDISPHSRTSVLFASRTWPIKPDICMEGGNVLHDGAADFHGNHPLLSVRTTDHRDDLAIASANATSAATAQAARLAAMAQAKYPEYWPETLRGLLVHAANWTPTMRANIDGAKNKTDRLSLLRRYGWGAPTEPSVLDSSRSAVTLVTQDTFTPFTGKTSVSRSFRLHTLPWPAEQLRELGPADVTLRVTLSYFIEPTASRRGWRRRYSYASHGLRFELKTPTETVDQFVGRVNYQAQKEEDGGPASSSGSDRWLVGSNQRNTGSLHQDLWEGSAADLAECHVLSVHPVGGWWKYSGRVDRRNLPVRYALLVSLATVEEGVDLYAPIAVQVDQPVGISVSAT